MIDTHNHILPFMDDGAADWQAALTMAEDACRDGIKTVIATPHHANGQYMNPAAEIRESVRLLNERLQGSGIPLQVLAGQEIRVYADLLDDLDRGELLTLANSRYILLEMPSSRVPRNMEEVCHELVIQGYVPVIAHPERNAEIAADPARLQRMIELGAIGQLTAQSVAGVFGGKLQKLSLELCRRGSAQLIASDAHNSGHRPFGLSEAYRVLEKEIGTDFCHYFRRNAQQILVDQEIIIVDNVNANTKVSKLFSFFSRKR
ncbi:tyrosine-protein phosphatase [Paenibacillus donghaensis]|uniref:tyrosine-protein phosphatase n=1 Tax=Paenibacillus donghaensis TaxID=414771 RepID=UPI001FEC9EE9|nr:CpsB/CapC family capsule biosynthesis tyrosine phosphatase [Paenibacillus donghaensis]